MTSPKSCTRKTTTIIIDIQKINFEYLKSKKVIVVYDISKQLESEKDYAKKFIWIKNICSEHPFYYNDPTESLYVLHDLGFKPLQNDGRMIEYTIFSNFEDPNKIHCWFNLLASEFSKSIHCINHNIFYLLSSIHKTFANVLEIRFKHNYFEKSRYEILVSDRATRMKQITKSEYENNEYYKKKIPHVAHCIKDKLKGFRQIPKLSISSLREEAPIWINDTNKNYRTKITYHSLKSEKYEKTRIGLLHSYLKNLIDFIKNNYNIEISLKHIEITQNVKTSSKSTGVDLSNFNVTIVDGRLNPNYKKLEDVYNQIKSISSFKNNHVVEVKLDLKKAVEEISQKGVYLLLMDYNKSDFDEDGILRDYVKDPYPTFKESFYVKMSASQGLCINQKYYSLQEKEQKLKYSSKDNSNHESYTPETYLCGDVISNKTLARNYEICLYQLYLKDIVINPENIKDRLPFFIQLKNKVFIKKNENQNYNIALYIDGNNLKIEKIDIDSNIILQITGNKHTLKSINQKRMNILKPFPEISNLKVQEMSSYKNGLIVIDKNNIYEIQSLQERAFYEEEIFLERINKLEEEYPVDQFTQFKGATKTYSYEQIESFINFIKNKVAKEHTKISYKSLLKHYKEDLDSLLGKPEKSEHGSLKLKQSDFKNFLKSYCHINIEGTKKGGIFDTASGIWYDEKKLQYFVGSKNNYNQEQEVGTQMYKILEIEGKFNEKEYFDWLNVSFIRYGGYTVLPFPFKLMDIWLEMNNR